MKKPIYMILESDIVQMSYKEACRYVCAMQRAGGFPPEGNWGKYPGCAFRYNDDPDAILELLDRPDCKPESKR